MKFPLMQGLQFSPSNAMTAIVAAALIMPCLSAQEGSVKTQDQPGASELKGDDKDKAEVDRFAVPDGDVEVLVKHVGTLAAYRPIGRTLQDRQEDNLKRLAGVVAACDRILELKPEEKIEIFALENQFGALGAMGANASDEMKQKLVQLEGRLEADMRPAVAKLPALRRIQNQVAMISRAPVGERNAVADQLVSYVDRFGVDLQAAALASSVGRALGYSGETEVAANLFEYFAKVMKESDNSDLVSGSETMFGAARRLRLPGRFMEVTGRTDDGSEFNWAKYRGKVVLVDFWASWCGPCIGELPNMKANLSRYGDAGFAIVGVNLDSKREAYEKCVREKEITWENIVGDEAAGWNNPLATYYGINAIPTAILVDKEGKVISLQARGAVLDRLLQEQFGVVEQVDAEEAGREGSKSE